LIYIKDFCCSEIHVPSVEQRCHLYRNPLLLKETNHSTFIAFSYSVEWEVRMTDSI
jgi:hypothetical protein